MRKIWIISALALLIGISAVIAQKINTTSPIKESQEVSVISSADKKEASPRQKTRK